MSDIKLCRICVRKDVKMYEHDRFQLMFYYKEVTGSKISSRDCLPKWFCFECAALLHKFHEFKIKCTRGQNVFKKLLETGSANKTQRIKFASLQPHLQILSALKNKHVKTYTIQHKVINSNTSKNNIKNKHNNFTKVFVNDIKSDVDIIKNPKLLIEILAKTSTDQENNAEDNEKQIYDDHFDNDNDDSNSIPLVINTEDAESLVIDEVGPIETTNECTLDKRTTNAEEQTDNERTTHNLERTNTDTKRTDEKDRITDKNTVLNNTEVNEAIKDPDKVNLDNKFQRSVKKKFLDENHWTKITLTDEEATRRFKAKSLEQKYIKAEYKCVDCYRTFSQEDMMKRHIKLRHCESLGPNECRHCRMRFKWKSRLQKHLKEHYTIYKCLRCELSFPVEISAFQHDYSHNGVTWTCAHCGQGFRHSSTYYTHLRKHKSKYVCTLCGVSFVSEFGLFMHKRVKHVINDDSIEENSDTYCKVCDIQFDTLRGYEEHFAESALHATEVLEGATCLPLKTRCTKKRVPRISTNCASCGKTFSTYAAFSKHHLSVHPNLALPKSRTDKQDGQRQICEVCGVTLASTWSLVNHLNTHSRDKRYTCKTCGMQLSSRSVLQRHQATHSSDSNFSCDICGKTFTHRSGLRLHVRTHEKNQGRCRKKKSAEPHNIMDYFKNYGNLNNYR